MSRRPLVLAALLALPLAAQQAPAYPENAGARRAMQGPPTIERIDTAALARIRDEAMNRSQVMAIALGLSDLQPPRLAGSPGYLQAARWARDWLRGHGFRAELEPHGRATPSWVVDRHSAEMVAPFYMRLNAFPRAWSPATRGAITAPVMAIRLRADSDTVALKGKLRGKILLNGAIAPLTDRSASPMRRWTSAELDSLARLPAGGEPESFAKDVTDWKASMAARRRLAAFLAREGALALVDPSGTEGTLGAYGWWGYPAAAWGGVPSFVVEGGQFNRLLRLLEAKQPVRLTLSLAARFVKPDSVGYNVIGELPGSDPALAPQVVMMGGHLDSWIAGSGATDDAAGCAIAMEVLRVLKATGLQPRRTIRIGLWDGEETSDDYIGSTGYVMRHFGDPYTGARGPEHDRLSVYFNVDNGAGAIRGLWLQGNTAAQPLFSQLLAPFADLGATTISLQNTGSTDHLAFWGVGLPAFQFIQDPLDYESRTHHTSLDVGDYLSEPDMKQAVTVLAGLVYHVAQRDALVPRQAVP